MPRKDPKARAEYDRGRTSAWAKANPERHRANGRRARGIIDAPGEKRVGQCPICPFFGPLVLDHDHSSGRIRGWVCNQCNLRLATAEDAVWLQAARAYLKEHNV
jgi:hypothetical protein